MERAQEEKEEEEERQKEQEKEEEKEEQVNYMYKLHLAKNNIFLLKSCNVCTNSNGY